MHVDVADAAATTALGRRLGEMLFPGATVALIGPLGAGKTYLVRAIAEGLGIADARAVSSPTFVLIQEYEARLPIYHFDAYRLKSASEFFDLGAHEYFDGQGICIVEWADRVETCLPAEHLRITIAVTGETTRRLTVEGRGERYKDLARRLGESPNSNMPTEHEQQPDTVPLRLVWKTVLTKVIGLQAGAIVGGLGLTFVCWLDNETLNPGIVAVGTLSGALAGVSLTAGGFGRIGWSVLVVTCVVTFLAAIFTHPSELPARMIAAAVGMMLGLLVGVVLEVLHATHGPASPCSNEPSPAGPATEKRNP